MRYRLVVWDFDGTLANTMELALHTYNELAGKHRIKPVEDPAAVRGLSSRTFMKRHGISLFKLPFLIRDFQATQKNHMPGVRIFDGLPGVLHRLLDQGVRLGILSSNSRENIQACLRANGLEDVFTFVLGYPRLFGKAKAMRRLLRSQGVAPGQMLYVGDEVRDVEAAQKAGVDIAAVTWGFQTPEVLANVGPTYLIHQPDDLLGLVAQPQG
jgi:phosphoglycolate phosphatase